MKFARKTARKLFKLCLVAGLLDHGRVLAVTKKVIQSKPRGYLAILSSFHRLVRLEVEKSQANIESAIAIGSEIKSQIEEDLGKVYRGGDLTFHYQTNPELLGGLRIKIGSDVWDGSVKAKLQRLQDALG